MKIKFVIPARGGSKGIPGKNIKILGGAPLINHTINQARRFVNDDDIIVTTDDDQIISTVEQNGYKVPFKRPQELAKYSSGMNEVLLHAVEFIESQGEDFDIIVLLQPTSPFRKDKHIQQALDTFTTTKPDMVVSVKETRSNPYYLLVEENQEGILEKVKEHDSIRRQDTPVVYEFNGAVYVIDVNKLKELGLSGLKHKRKIVMDETSSHDLDEMLDWYIAEMIIDKNIDKIDA